MSTGKRASKEAIAQAIQAVAEGMSKADAAKKYKMSANTLNKHLKTTPKAEPEDLAGRIHDALVYLEFAYRKWPEEKPRRSDKIGISSSKMYVMLAIKTLEGE